ncbi:zinc-binding dehydrogenase [Vibrio sp.]|nr:zinc-binding dehydrogenase [Vibrio sp.]
MKAVIYCQSKDLFQLADIPTPEIEYPHDVLIKVNAVGLNPVDAKVDQWHEMVYGMTDQFVGGLDVSGEITQIGDSVTEWEVGDRVVYHGNMRRAHGGFAEYAIHDSRTLLTHPKIAIEKTAVIPCAAWTAYRALVDKLRISTRQSIFIAGGAGGVGSFAIQLAKQFGVPTIITTATTKNHDYLHRLGATHTVDYLNENVIQKVISITNGMGVDVSLDCVGGDSAIDCANVLAYEGEMVELVQLSQPSDYNNAFLKGLTFHQLSLGSGHVYGDKGQSAMVEAGYAVNSMIERNDIQLPHIEVITLDQIPDALYRIRQQRTVGKIVAKLA